MILINLLPHREAARKKRQDVFNVSLGASAVLGGLIAGVIFLWLEAQISAQERLNMVLTQEIAKLDNQIKEIAQLEAEIAALRARQQAVENLQADRNMPVYLLSELASQLPEGVYLNTMKQDNQLVVLQGAAQSQERVSELLRNMSYHTPWFSRPELIEIVAAKATMPNKEQREVYNYSIRLQLVRASDVQKQQAAAAAAAAASAPAAGKK